MPVKKNQFIQNLASRMNIPKKQAGEWYDTFLDEVLKSMKSGDKKLSLSGFGIFKVVDRPARMARNPRTGEMVQVKASKKAKFVPAKALKEAVL
ncbi:MAG: HU family DNA-binding protein [Candidatus Yanofskybacteria bacterium]|nr:HU family DNA-binding protein [Candidatus Yanofskybacteria bacterium]